MASFSSPDGGQSPSNPANVFENIKTTSSVPLFIVLQADNEQLSKMSPFLINKYITNAAGVVKNIRKQRSGELLVEAVNITQANSLLKIKNFGDLNIQAFGHKTLNYTKGVIYSPELSMVSDDEFKEELNSQKVCDAKRIINRKNGETKPTNLVILTFDTPVLPKQIIAGYLKINVRPFIPNPLRCFKCQKYGHSRTTCRSRLDTCGRCGEEGHDSVACMKKAYCVNCQGEHPAYSKLCPKYQLEKEVQTLKITNNISFPDARKLVESRTPRENTPYSSVIKVPASIPTKLKNLKSITTQTTSEIHSGLKIIVPTKFHTCNETNQSKIPAISQTTINTSTSNQIKSPVYKAPIPNTDGVKSLGIGAPSTSKPKETAKTSKIVKLSSIVESKAKPSAWQKKNKNIIKSKAALTANMFLKKQKLEKASLKLHVSSDESLLESSDVDGEMDVEKGMEVLPHLKDRPK